MRLFAFDLDDNVVVTNQRILTSTHGPLTTFEYQRLRDVCALAPDAFDGLGDESLLLEAQWRCGPSWPILLEALRLGEPVAIVTARANSPAAIRDFLNACLRAEGAPTLDGAHIYCCNNEAQCRELGISLGRVETRKVEALQRFLAAYPACSAVGYSDDDARNLRSVAAFFRSVEEQRPHLKIRLYLSTETDLHRVSFSEQPMGHHMEGSSFKETLVCQRDGMRTPLET